MPQEIQRERVDCVGEKCKSVFYRPLDAAGELSTADVAQLHGWTLIDREKGLLHCAWGHTE
jgi:hypothetical protein